MAFYGGDFSSPLEGLADNLLDFSESTEDECIMLNTGPERVRTKEAYAVDETAQCIALVDGSKLEYELKIFQFGFGGVLSIDRELLVAISNVIIFH